MRDVAEQLGVGKRQAYYLAACGAIPSVRINGRIRVPRAAWERWCLDQVEKALDRCKQQSAKIGAKIGANNGRAA